MSEPAWRRVPGVPRVVVDARAGREARRTVALTGASDWRRAALDRTASALVAVAGPARLPATGGWPWPAAGPSDLERALRQRFPALRLLGAVVPRQRGRARLSLLTRYAGDLLVVKLGADAPALRTEHRALELLAADPLPGIATPLPFGDGVLDLPAEPAPVAFNAASAVGLDTQRPAFDAPLHTFESDLGRRLAALPRPEGGDAGLVPVHGDLTPWNLRWTDRGLALFDWEAVGWGRPGSDVAHYRAASAELRPWWRREARG